jgi:hypothetical protein
VTRNDSTKAQTADLWLSWDLLCIGLFKWFGFAATFTSLPDSENLSKNLCGSTDFWKWAGDQHVGKPAGRGQWLFAQQQPTGVGSFRYRISNFGFRILLG